MSSPKVLRSVADLRKWRAAQRQLGNPVGLVPTMGALHEGHMNLFKRSLSENSASVVSIFINPSQFAPTEDLEKYPRSLDTDMQRILDETLKQGVNMDNVAVFNPSVNDMYPSGITLDVSRQVGTFIEVLGFSHQLEGATRPQFFRGVATVVNKLLNAVQPDRAYFGQKDVQQASVVKRMVKDLLMPVTIVVGETARESSGLALSSRNAYLDDAARRRGGVIYGALSAARGAFQAGERSSERLIKIVKEILIQDPFIQNIEYISVNRFEDLEPLQTAVSGAVVSTAVGVLNKEEKPMRLLDNVIL